MVRSYTGGDRWSFTLPVSMIVYTGKRPQAIRSHPDLSRYLLSLPGIVTAVNDRLAYEQIVPWLSLWESCHAERRD